VITVAQKTAIPQQRYARPHLTALVISPNAENRTRWSRPLHGVGIGNVLEAAGPQQALVRGRQTNEHGVCLIQAAPQDPQLLHTVRELKRQGWDRVVLVSPRSDAKTIRLALATRIRNVVVAEGKPAERSSASRAVNADTNLALSDREIQVVQHVANGHTNRSIGEQLNLSALTVKSHLSRIGRKLGTGDRAHIVATCMRAGLIG
jgi:DNA-binding NarL/FixJ family response regulator